MSTAGTHAYIAINLKLNFILNTLILETDECTRRKVNKNYPKLRHYMHSTYSVCQNI